MGFGFDIYLSRRDFIKIASSLFGFLLFGKADAKELLPKLGFKRKKEALFWEPLENKEIRCLLCPRKCIVEDGRRGFCRARENEGGIYYTLTYGNPCAVHIDPIEKKPFFHVLPGTYAFSIATSGCNLRCKFCQNWRISQAKVEETFNFDLPPKVAADLAKRLGTFTVTSTYTEPTVFFEYSLDIAKRANELGLIYTYHSNGFINQKPLLLLSDYLKAACIDLKGFSDKFYNDMSDAWLSPVLATLKTLKKKGVWVEIVNLVVPTKNDDEKMIKDMVLWIRDNLGDDVPLHFTRFFPRYKLLNLFPTPIKTLEMAKEIALSFGLKYVYIGNVPGHKAQNTYCPKCGMLLIERKGFFVENMKIKDGRCPKCGEKIPGVWSI